MCKQIIAFDATHTIASLINSFLVIYRYRFYKKWCDSYSTENSNSSIKSIVMQNYYYFFNWQYLKAKFSPNQEKWLISRDDFNWPA